MTQNCLSRNKSAAFLALVVVAPLFAWSCNRTKQDDCTRHIREKILSGSTAQLAESELRNCGFKVTFDPEKRSLYGDKTVPGAVVSERTQITVTLDANNRVSGVLVTTS